MATNPYSIITVDPSDPKFPEQIKNDPIHQWKTGIAEEDAATALARENQRFADQMNEYNVRASMAGNTGGGIDLSGVIRLEKELKDLQEAKMRKDSENKQEYLHELMSSRGLHDSGQHPLEHSEESRALDFLIKQADLQYDARVEGHRASQAASAAAAAAASANARMGIELAKIETIREHGYRVEDIQTGLKREKGSILIDTVGRVQTYNWDDNTGNYVGIGGAISPNQAADSVINKPPVPPQPEPPAATYGDSGPQPGEVYSSGGKYIPI